MNRKMKTRIKGRLLLLFAPAYFTLSCNAQSKNIPVKPNVIIILADDMGYGDISGLNHESKITTPVLDQMIKEGRNFSEAHTNASLCTPARYSLLTGRYSFRNGLNGVATGYSKPMIEYDRETLPAIFKKAGYNTAIIGKWHLGLAWQQKDTSLPVFTKDDYIPENLNVDYSRKVAGVNEIGFDYSFISPAGNNLAPFCFVKNGTITELPTDTFIPQVGGIYENNYVLRRNGGDKAPGYHLDETLSTLTREAINYIKGYNKSSPPFFLLFSLTAPHFPWMPQKEFIGKSAAGAYGDFIEEIDARVGQLLNVLESQGMDKNTLVIFTADNGASVPKGFFEKYHHEMNKGRRGQKAEIWEGGTRVPFIARWKSVLPAGTHTDSPIGFVDMMATFAAMLHVQLSSQYAEDSYDVSSALLGLKKSKKILSRGPMINQSGKAQGISITKNNWKLIPYGYGWQGIEPAPEGNPPGQLYNLAIDPLETNNVYDQHLDIVKKLSDILEIYKHQGYSRPLFNKN